MIHKCSTPISFITGIIIFDHLILAMTADCTGRELNFDSGKNLLQ